MIEKILPIITIGILLYLLCYAPESFKLKFTIINDIIKLPYLYYLLSCLFFIILKMKEKISFGYFFIWIFLIQLIPQLQLLMIFLSNQHVISGIYKAYIVFCIYAVNISLSYYVGYSFLRTTNTYLASLTSMTATMLFINTFYLFYYFHYFQGFLLCLTLMMIGFLMGRLYGKKIFRITDILASLWNTEKKLILFILIIAFSVRLLFGLKLFFQLGENFILNSDDGSGYDNAAILLSQNFMNLFNGAIDHSPNGPAFGHLYWIFLGLIYKIFGRHMVIVILIQSLIHTAMIYCIYFSSQRLFNSTVAKLIAIVCALHTAMIHSAITLNVESIFIPFIFISLYFFQKYKEIISEKIFIKKEFKFLILSALFMGLAIITRPIILLYGFGIALYTVYLEWHKNKKMAYLKGFIYTCILILNIAPITLINYFNVHHFVLLTAQGPNQWRIDHNDPHSPGNTELIKLGIEPFQNLKGSITAFIKTPGPIVKTFLQIISKRIIKFFFVAPFGYFDPLYFLNNARIPNDYSPVLKIFSFFLFFIGLFSYFKYVKNSDMFIYLSLLGYYIFFQPILFYVLNIRYRLPIIPILVMFTCFGFYYVYRKLIDNIQYRYDS